MQLRTLGKCRFRPSGGFLKPKIFLYAPRQLMVALRLDSLAGTQPPNISYVPPRLLIGGNLGAFAPLTKNLATPLRISSGGLHVLDPLP